MFLLELWPSCLVKSSRSVENEQVEFKSVAIIFGSEKNSQWIKLVRRILLKWTRGPVLTGASLHQLNTKTIMVQFQYLRLYLAIGSFFSSSVCTDGKDEHGLRLEKVGPTFSSLTLSAKITKRYYSQCSSIKFVWYLFNNSRGAFCEVKGSKGISNDYSTELT